jgi:hypothetical protein
MLLAAYSPFSSTLKMDDAVCSYETTVNFSRIDNVLTQKIVLCRFEFYDCINLMWNENQY